MNETPPPTGYTGEAGSSERLSGPELVSAATALLELAFQAVRNPSGGQTGELRIEVMTDESGASVNLGAELTSRAGAGEPVTTVSIDESGASVSYYERGQFDGEHNRADDTRGAVKSATRLIEQFVS